VTLTLGRVVATPGALRTLEKAGISPASFLIRHANGDWGELDEHDRMENEFSLNNGFRILSNYVLSNGEKVWVITEADRSSTCILLPSEY
jgi:hypothetical protein